MSRPKKLQTTLTSNYKNFIIGNKDEDIDQLDFNDKGKAISSIDFFNVYISPRKPVKLVNYPLIGEDGSEFDISKFSSENILETLNYDLDLQIERKYKAGFGSGQEREKFSLEKLIQLFGDGHDEYYLTTQYDFDEPKKHGDLEEEFNEEGDEEDDGNENTVDEEDEEEENDRIKDDNEEEGIDVENPEDEDPEDEDDNEEEVVEEEEEDKQLPPISINIQDSDFSDTSSIDMNNLHDDFEESEEEEEPEEGDDLLDEELQLRQSESDQRIKELLQPPLTNLVHHPQVLSIRPQLFSTLIPQQINLWMGNSSLKDTEIKLNSRDHESLGLGKYIPGGGTSSGLHHDHADNLYILASGKKRFTLFSPADATKLHTIGSIFKLFNSGIIDYEINENAPNWKHIRDDGAILEDIIDWTLENDAVKGEERIKLLNELQSIIKQQKKFADFIPIKKLDPPNFSKIPPSLLHIDEFPDEKVRRQLIDFANRYFPGFLQLNNYKVWLKRGEMLYLPAGWFHEVSSFGDKSQGNVNEEGNQKNKLSNVHIALNYWFVPPNSTNFKHCYEDNYWHQDWSRTQKCLNLIRKE
ncbi:cupin-like domain-containing protein [Scheffersomyces coipomensis]|uniref:cupin-like domain-containing protein n=1 Tax=Scheffersomyces coipomensis TaxID=1788519 RepID=UPI00315D0E23